MAQKTCRAGVSRRRRLGSAHKTDNHIRVWGGGGSGLHIWGTPQLCAVQTVTGNDHQASQGSQGELVSVRGTGRAVYLRTEWTSTLSDPSKRLRTGRRSGSRMVAGGCISAGFDLLQERRVVVVFFLMQKKCFTGLEDWFAPFQVHDDVFWSSNRTL